MQTLQLSKDVWWPQRRSREALLFCCFAILSHHFFMSDWQREVCDEPMSMWFIISLQVQQKYGVHAMALASRMDHFWSWGWLLWIWITVRDRHLRASWHQTAIVYLRDSRESCVRLKISSSLKTMHSSNLSFTLVHFISHAWAGCNLEIC